MTVIGEALKAHRRKQGLSQGDLAERLGCTQGLVAHWEKGAGLPSKYATAIGRELGWTMDQLDDARRGVAVPGGEDSEPPPVELPARPARD